MASPQQKPSELEDVLRRLRSAASDLESAAYRADEAIGEIESAATPDGSFEVIYDSAELADLVAKLHDDEHEGPMRWCTREVCKAADEIRAASRG